MAGKVQINADLALGFDYAIGQSQALPASSATSGPCKKVANRFYLRTSALICGSFSVFHVDA
jgi:hypothetical protein